MNLVASSLSWLAAKFSQSLQLGLSTISAYGVQIYSNRPCFELRINYSPLTKLSRYILKRPLKVLAQSRFQPWLLNLWPTLLLPRELVLKQRRPENSQGYEREKEVYFALRHIQGSFIPYYYAEVSYSHMPAIIMSKAAGTALQEFTMTKEETGRVLVQIKAAYNLFAEAGVVHADPELHNFLWDGERIVVIDFDGAEFHTGKDVRKYSAGDYREVERRLLRSTI